MKRNIFAFLALLALHGCNTVEDPFLESMTGSMPVATGNRELPVHLASASLTGLGAMPIGLRQTSMDGITRQILVWANTTTLAGENTLTISTAAASGSALRKGPNRSEISRTLRSEFPNVVMAIDPVIRQNAYGAYGAATGKLGDNGGCVYAWQLIDRDTTLGRDKPVDIRLRYCHQALAPEVLADLLAGLTLRGPATAPPVAGIAYGYAAPAVATTSFVPPIRTEIEAAEVAPTAEVSAAETSELESNARIGARIPKP